MSILGELEKTKTYLRNTRKAILGRGGEISTTAGFKDVSNAIFNIPADASLAYQVDDDVAYRKTILAGAEKYALLSSVGGMTYKSNNLLKSLSTYANTTVEDGVVKQITADSRTEFNFKIQKHNGTVVTDILAVSPTITSLGVVAMTFTKSSDFERIVFGVNGSQRDTTASAYVSNLIDGKVYTLSFNVTNITQGSISWCDVMLNEGSTALPYEPFYEGLRDSKVTEIKNYGANLFSASMVVGGYVSGSGQFSVSVGGEKSFIAKCKPNTTYTLSKLNTSIVRVAGFANEPTNKAQGELLKEVANNTTEVTFTTRTNEYIAVFYLNNTNEANTNENVIASIMLNNGSTALPHKPYREPISYPIPAEIQVGKGVSGFGSDTIDFESGKRIEKTYTVIFDGVTNGKKIGYVGIYSSLYYASLDVPFKCIKNDMLICSHFKAVATVAQGNCYIAGANGTSLIFVPNDQSLDTIDKVNAWLKEQYDSGNPVTVTYVLEEPIETDISAELEGFKKIIDVEGGGVLEFVNEYKNPVPSTIKYATKVGG